MKQQGDEMKI